MTFTCSALLSTLLSFVLSSVANAQSQMAEPRQIDSAAMTLKAADVSTAPQVFRGYPPYKKGEFESTAAFRTRIGARLGKEKFFAIDVTAQCELFGPCIRYDADKEEISVSRPSPTSYLFGLLLRHFSTPIRTYVGKNGFGAAVRITESKETEFVLIPAEGYFASGDLILHMRGDSAARLKPRIKLLAVFAPGPDSTGQVMREESEYKEPTTSYPYEEHRTYFVMSAKTISLYLWDPVSGMILRKWHLSPEASTESH